MRICVACKWLNSGYDGIHNLKNNALRYFVIVYYKELLECQTCINVCNFAWAMKINIVFVIKKNRILLLRPGHLIFLRLAMYLLQTASTWMK